MNAYARLHQVAQVLAPTFPDGPPYVALELDDYVIRNDRYVLRMAAQLIEHLEDRSAGDIAQVLVGRDYAADLRTHECLEVLQDLTWRPCPAN